MFILVNGTLWNISSNNKIGLEIDEYCVAVSYYDNPNMSYGVIRRGMVLTSEGEVYIFTGSFFQKLPIKVKIKQIIAEKEFHLLDVDGYPWSLEFSPDEKRIKMYKQNFNKIREIHCYHETNPIAITVDGLLYGDETWRKETHGSIVQVIDSYEYYILLTDKGRVYICFAQYGGWDKLPVKNIKSITDGNELYYFEVSESSEDVPPGTTHIGYDICLGEQELRCYIKIPNFIPDTKLFGMFDMFGIMNQKLYRCINRGVGCYDLIECPFVPEKIVGFKTQLYVQSQDKELYEIKVNEMFDNTAPTIHKIDIPSGEYSFDNFCENRYSTTKRAD